MTQVQSAGEAIYPSLERSYCTQLSLGVDIRVLPRQVGTLRDLVQSLSPGDDLPWHFRESYVGQGTEYEILASLGPARMRSREHPYALFIHLGAVGADDEDQSDLPTVRELLEILALKEPARVFCTARFSYPEGVGTSRIELPAPLETAATGGELQIERLIGETVEFAVQREGKRFASVDVTGIGGSYRHKVSFYHSGMLDVTLPAVMLRQAVALSRTLHDLEDGRENQEVKA